MLNWYVRYEPFIRVLDELEAEDVLDVGSGWHGLSWCWPHRVVQTDLSFAGKPPPGPRTGSAVAISSSAEALPFADGAFDFVVSSDMMEHLPEQIRGPSIAELVRVARRGVIVGFPHAASRSHDRLVAGLLRSWRKPVPDWLDEHLRQSAYPGRATVAGALPPSWSITCDYPNGNWLLSVLVYVAEFWRSSAPVAAAWERRARRHGMPRFVHWWPTLRRVYLIEPGGGRAVE